MAILRSRLGAIFLHPTTQNISVRIFYYAFVVVLLNALTIPILHATTLSQAVNAQLATISTPCERLLGGDSISVLTGNLASVICSRSVPFGSTPQDTSSGAANSSAVSSSSSALLSEARNKNALPGKNEEKAQLAPNWTFFLTADAGRRNRDVSSAEDGYDSHTLALLTGVTYRLSEANTLAAALSLNHHRGDYSSGGDFEDQANGIRLLETYNPTANTFVQAVAGYDAVSSQRTRYAVFNEYFNNALVFSQSGTPKADYSYAQYDVSLLGGYNYTLGSYSIVPQIGLTWLSADYGTYAESGTSGLALVIHNDKRKSLQSSVGVQITKTISTHFGVMIPQFDVRWKHEFADKSRQVQVSFLEDTRGKIFTYDTEAADKDFVDLGAGMQFVFARGIQSFVRLQTTLGQQYYHTTMVSLGLNMEF